MQANRQDQMCSANVASWNLVRMADLLVSMPIDGTGLDDVTELASISC